MGDDVLVSLNIPKNGTSGTVKVVCPLQLVLLGNATVIKIPFGTLELFTMLT